jgi:hypothetical protein
MSKKRSFISIQKTKHREELLEKIQEQDEFSNLDNSMIFQRLLEIAVGSPGAFKIFQDDSKTLADERKELLDSQIQLTELSIKAFQELSNRLDDIEKVLKIERKKESNYKLNIFDDET